ncbi:ArsR/SmtB family transcription factor [Paenibacillus pasadenensis]|nr:MULTISPECIES: metalloregulator ArsR/SmtB family transcription factor [Paenibacillus]QGG56326.1 metalloregulator ArsR/SmtB family transcription factor [Paenibacillus sp. B01]
MNTDAKSQAGAEVEEAAWREDEPSELEGEHAAPEQPRDLSAVKAAMLDDRSALQLADWLKALSDPTRVKLVDALMHSELCVHDLTVLLGMNQSAVSHQLRYLRNMRIVKRRKEGKTVYYSLDDDHVEQVFRQTLEHVRHS